MKEFEKLSEEMKNIVLTQKERAALRFSILDFIKTNPVSSQVLLRLIFQRSIIYSWQLLALFIKKPMPILLILALILGGGGVSFAAENALPGDVLYPVKVKVNEEVVAALAFSPEAKVNWEARRLERRLEEAEHLAEKGELKAEVRERIEENFERHAGRVRVRIAEFEAKDLKAAADISSNLEVSLQAHARILAILATSTGQATTTATEVGKLLFRIKTRGDDASRLRIEIEAKVASSTQPEVKNAAEGKLKAAENKIEEVKKFIAAMQERLGEEATLEAEARLKVAENTVIEGRAKLEAKAFADAFGFFQKAHRIAQEAKLLIKAREDLKIDVRIKNDEDEEGAREEERDENENRGRGRGGIELELGL